MIDFQAATTPPLPCSRSVLFLLAASYWLFPIGYSLSSRSFGARFSTPYWLLPAPCFFGTLVPCATPLLGPKLNKECFSHARNAKTALNSFSINKSPLKLIVFFRILLQFLSIFVHKAALFSPKMLPNHLIDRSTLFRHIFAIQV